MKEKFSFHRFTIWVVMTIELVCHVVAAWNSYSGIKSIRAQWDLVLGLEKYGADFWEQFILAQKMGICAHAVLFVFLCSALYQSKKKMHIAWGYYITFEFFNLLLVDLTNLGAILYSSVKNGNNAIVEAKDMLVASATNPVNIIIAAWIVVLFVVRHSEKKTAAKE